MSSQKIATGLQETLRPVHHLAQNFFAQVIVTPSLKSWKETFVHVSKMSTEMMYVSGAVVKETAGVNTVSEIQGSSNEGPPCH